MALSHQWFVQWSPPSMVITDINDRYNMNNWNNDGSKWSRDVTQEHYDKYDNYRSTDSRKRLDKNDDGLKNQINTQDISPAAGFALWLTMLGVARAQSVPADMETPPFNTLYKWKQIEFEFPSLRHKKNALATGKYVPANVLPLGLEVWGSRIFVTIPRWKQGIPATLTTVSRFGGITSPPLKPYPDWKFNSVSSNSINQNCSGLVSVFRVHIDPCGRLWVLDSGQTNSVKVPNQICPPSLLVFDLSTDELLARYEIPKKYVLQDSLYANIVIDTRTEDCSDVYVYMADTWRFGLLVFRESDQRFWRFSHPFFFPDPLASNFTLHGLNFQWTDGIFGLALSATGHFQDRLLFFHPMSSNREFYVPTSILRDPSRISNSSSEFRLLGPSRGPSSQSSASAVDNRGVMFYGLVTQDSIGCWDSSKPFQRETNGLVAKNSETLVFPNDVKLDQEKDQNVWVITNKLPMYQNAPLNPDDYNYRILYANAVEAVKGSVCDPDADVSTFQYRAYK